MCSSTSIAGALLGPFPFLKADIFPASSLSQYGEYPDGSGEFYGLPVNNTTIQLEKRPEPCLWPEKILSEAGPVTVFNPGFPVHWHVEA